ncbi:MAG: prepilin-type N-terminal cleavage/methylation domain-containing protein [bacterium]
MRDPIRRRTNGGLRRIIRGYTLIEVIIVMIIISIIAAVSMRSLRQVDEDQRTQQTVGAMNRLADAVAGDPDLVSGGSRIDYGYVGDVGGLPANLDALVSNPGLGTWDGPYLQDEFYASSGGAALSFKQDAWGQAYSYAGGVTITSTGGPGSLTRNIAGSADDLLRNQLTAVVTDRNDSPPGAVQKDSVKLVLTYPNGSGGYTNRSVHPDAGGFLEFDSIPIGQHTLRLVHEPTNDTLSRLISVDPGASPHVDFRYYAEVWSDTSSGGGGGGTLEYVSGTAATTGAHCNQMEFKLYNPTASSITIGSLTATWSSPTAYYKRVRWDGSNLYNSNNPRIGSGQVCTFGSSTDVAAGDTVLVEIQEFCSNSSGSCGSKIDMSDVDIQIDLPDGSSFTFSTGVCH